MKHLLVIISAILLMPGLLGNAAASLYSYDFSEMGFPQNKSIEGLVLDFATFTSEAGRLVYSPRYGGGILGSPGADADIYISFSVPVFDLSFTAGDGAGDLDAYAVTLYAFGTDTLLGTWSTPQFGGPKEPEWYTLNITESSIGRLVFDPGNAGSLPGAIGRRGGILLTDFSYNATAVPVPATILLLATGLIGLASLRRKLKV